MAGIADLRVCGTRVHRATDDARDLTYLVSDLHLPIDDGRVLADLRALLERVRRDPARTRLLVLGDLLSGLVTERQLRLGRWRELVTALRGTVEAGVSVSVLHGNRDFMLGDTFAAASGCRVVAGGLALELDGRRTVVLHGDELCTNDIPYQRSKRWLRSWWVRRICASVPMPVAAAIGRRARARSGTTMARGDQGRFTPVADAVAEVFAAGFAVLVFGHVHTPGTGTCGAGEYFVLPAFDETAVYLVHRRGDRLRYAEVDDEARAPAYGPLRFAPPGPSGTGVGGGEG